MRHVHVTGVSDLLGRSVCTQLYEQNFLVTAIAHAKSFFIKILKRITLDLSSSWTLEQLPKSVDKIIYFSQSSKFCKFPYSALDVLNINMLSTS
jgi:hypothetical protein